MSKNEEAQTSHLLIKCQSPNFSSLMMFCAPTIYQGDMVGGGGQLNLKNFPVWICNVTNFINFHVLSTYQVAERILGDMWGLVGSNIGINNSIE